MTTIERMQELCDIISNASTAYYVYDNPIMSDKEWDKLYDELVKLEKQTGVILPNSPTQKVGGEALDKFVKVKHIAPLYSLDKAQSYQELLDWQERNKNILNFDTIYTVEYKFDGLPIAVTYKGGKMVQALTRGNGEYGEDVTEQAKTIRSLPLAIDYTGTIVVQGEVIMKLSELSKLNDSDGDKLKNARNAAAGSLKNLDPKVTASRNLDFFAYHINYCSDKKFATQQQIHQFLIAQKFLVEDFFYIISDISDIQPIISQVDKSKRNLDYLIDGLVIKINDRGVQAELGYTAKFPRAMIAYKFDAEETSTTLLGVTWQVGRTGKLTPVALLEPTELCGVTVSRATLNNYNDILRKKLKIGDRVFVRRSNEVIPEVLSVAQTSKNSKIIEEPKVCPVCGTSLVKTLANLYCPNHNGCSKQIIERLSHFASKNAMNIEGLSRKTIEVLHKNFGVSNFADLYTLSADQLLSLEGFKDKKVQNILDSLEASKKPELYRFIFALGIDSVGLKLAKTLANVFVSIDNLKSASISELDDIPDIAVLTATDIYEYFADEYNIRQIEKLLSAGVTIVNPTAKKIDSIFSGKKIVLTGTLEHFSRDKATNILESMGAVVSSSVSKSTSLVLAGANAGSKLDKAKQLGITIIGEDDFVNELRKHNISF